jgi:hypothetical protein
MTATDVYTTANTMWIFLAIGIVGFIAWGITALPKARKRHRVTTSTHKLLESSAHNYETER